MIARDLDGSVPALVAKLLARVLVRGPHECWPFTGAMSQSGRRGVFYGVIWEGRGVRRLWRAHRLALLLKTAPTEVLRDDDEPFLDWLARARRAYDHLEASHECDNSICCNPAHLRWQTHTDNVKDQAARRRQRAA